MSISEIITISISELGLVISVITLVMEFHTRKKVQEMQSKAMVYGYIDEDYFIIENVGEAIAHNVRYEGWEDWNDESSEYRISDLPPHKNRSIKLWITKDSPSQSTFKITWDDESGKGHVWEETLKMYRE